MVLLVIHTRTSVEKFLTSKWQWKIMNITIATSFTELRLEPEDLLQNTALPPGIPGTCKLYDPHMPHFP